MKISEVMNQKSIPPCLKILLFPKDILSGEITSKVPWVIEKAREINEVASKT